MQILSLLEKQLHDLIPIMDNCIHIGKVTFGPLNWILLNNRFTKFIFLANHCRTMKVQSLLKNNLTLKKSSMAQHHAHEGCTHRLFLIWHWKACMSVSWHWKSFRSLLSATLVPIWHFVTFSICEALTSLWIDYFAPTTPTTLLPPQLHHRLVTGDSWWKRVVRDLCARNGGKLMGGIGTCMYASG
jgi:hypothetical protein